ncbi:protein phosphatase 2C domain-containing protein [Actinomycetota bacterium]|nr:protein phosphatase 2C domain-containing protein [Actinomycetota bacterium]
MNDTNPEKDANDIDSDGVAAPSADDVTIDVAIEVGEDGQAALVVPDTAPPVTLRFAARSDVGLVRAGNEDSGYAGPRLLMVADGMGGHAAGELASAVAIATVADLDVHPPSSSELLNALTDAIDSTGETINAIINEEPDLTGMGTTVTGLYWLGSRVAIVHVGDSRAYLFRDHELVQLTHDHTYVQTLVDAGRITEEQAATHPKRSLLMRALDGMNPVEADLSVREARTGDRYLLCSDGLSGVVDSADIAGALTMSDPTGCVTRLVDLALERGAPDNVTVVVADVVADAIASDGTSETLFAPVVVGAAGEPRVRAQLPGVRFPDDAQPDPDAPEALPPVDGGPPTAPQPLIDAEIVVPAAEQAMRDEQAVAQRKTRRARRWKRVGIYVALIAVIAAMTYGALIAAQAWLQSQWYIAVNGSPGTGTVAIYQGVPGNLAGVSLSTLTKDTGLPAGQLPLFDQELVSKGIPAESEADAQRIVTELQVRADECQTIFPPAGCPGSLSNEPVEDAP